MRKLCITTLLAASLVLSGCTVYAVKNQPSIKTTTSSEQFQRLLWTAVKEKNWKQVPGMLAANVLYTANGKVLNKEQVIPYLQGLNLADFNITQMVVKPDGPDMTLSYTLQRTSAGQPPQTFLVLSVWQQARSGWILIAHSEQPQSQTAAP